MKQLIEQRRSPRQSPQSIVFRPPRTSRAPSSACPMSLPPGLSGPVELELERAEEQQPGKRAMHSDGPARPPGTGPPKPASPGDGSAVIASPSDPGSASSKCELGRAGLCNINHNGIVRGNRMSCDRMGGSRWSSPHPDSTEPAERIRSVEDSRDGATMDLRYAHFGAHGRLIEVA
jgi:hypothetical protein